jgi:AraC-like DNA-binding protein
VTDVTTISAPASGKRRPKDPAATIPLRDGDEGWTIPALASAFKMSERSFRERFVKTGLLPVSRLGGVDFASITAARNLVSDVIAGGADPRPRRPRRGRR